MSITHTTDLELTSADVGRITSVDALAAFLDRLGYATGSRTALTSEAIGYSDTDQAIRSIELLAEDEDGFLRVLFIHVGSITAKVRSARRCEGEAPIERLNASNRCWSIVLLELWLAAPAVVVRHVAFLWDDRRC